MSTVYSVHICIGIDSLKRVIDEVKKNKQSIVAVTQENRTYTVVCADSNNL